MVLHFSESWPFVLLLALPLIWWLAWQGKTRLNRRRMILAVMLRSLALIFMVLALMNATVRVPSHGVSVVYALDISRSVAPEFVRSALDWMRATNATQQPVQARYVAFGDRAHLLNNLDDLPAVAVMAESPKESNAPVQSDAHTIDQGATNIEQALTTSLFGFAPGYAKRLVLMTDGNQTEGDVWRALPQLQADHVRVFAVPATIAAGDNSWIESLLAPDDVRQQEPVTLKVRVYARARMPAQVRISDLQRTLASRSVMLAAGENKLAFQVRFSQLGANSITAQIIASNDHVKRNDALTQVIWVRPRTKVLYVEGAMASARYLAQALNDQGIEVLVASSDQLTRDAHLLDGVDVVVLSDVSPDSLTQDVGTRLEEFVRDRGRGLIFVAGENTYGKQGFSHSALERLLPVKFEGRRKRKELDLVLLIDRSYSMRGRKLELAKSAALASLDLLDEQHRLAVVAFDSKPHDVVPLAEVGSKRRAEDLISSMVSGGQTNIYAALAHAQRMLKNSRATSKHVILLSDGITAPPPGSGTGRSMSEESMEIIRKVREDTSPGDTGTAQAPGPVAVAQSGAAQLAQALAEDKITLSTVAIGDKPNLELMESLAKGANGRSYVAKSDSEIPAMFVAETRRLLGESIVEEPFRPIVSGRGEMLSGVDFTTAPMLRGFVVTKPKQFADVLLEAKDHQPLLAATYYGLGKTVAFLSDAKNRWAANWLSWQGYGQIWAQVVRAVVRRDAAGEISWHVTREGREAVIALTAAHSDARPRIDLTPKVRAISPRGQSSVIALRQVMPGKYQARWPLTVSRAAPYRFELIHSPTLSAKEIARAGTRGLFYPHSDEYRVMPPNLSLLKALSESTGGKLAPEPSEIFATRGDNENVSKALWHYFAATALIFFLLELFVRRAPWSLGVEN